MSVDAIPFYALNGCENPDFFNFLVDTELGYVSIRMANDSGIINMPENEKMLKDSGEKGVLMGARREDGRVLEELMSNIIDRVNEAAQKNESLAEITIGDKVWIIRLDTNGKIQKLIIE